MAQEDIAKTAIITPFGLFEYLRMPFGLRNAAQSFQRFMDQVFRGLDFVFTYIDDVLIASTNKDEHKQHLRQVFGRLQQYGITVNPEKCKFGRSEIEFLGHHINGRGIKPLPEKTQSILNYPTPQSVKSLRRFLGVVNYYGRFISNCAHILQPPYDGPYKVLQRKSKYFILDRNGTKDSVSIDRLKPAYLESPPKPALAERTHRPKPAIQTADSSVPPPSSPSPNSLDFCKVKCLQSADVNIGWEELNLVIGVEIKYGSQNDQQINYSVNPGNNLV
nr:gag pol polyprotein [Hymenolepis microstoma]